MARYMCGVREYLSVSMPLAKAKTFCGKVHLSIHGRMTLNLTSVTCPCCLEAIKADEVAAALDRIEPYLKPHPSKPQVPVDGDCYTDKKTGKLMVHHGGAWKAAEIRLPDGTTDQWPYRKFLGEET